ncbi:MAG: zinc ribbon domain-containing protein [Nitrososphaerales archaeon]
MSDIIQEAKRIKEERINSTKGFYKREEAREFKNLNRILTDEDVEKLAMAVLSTKVSRIPEPYNTWLRRRNSAIISTFYLFPKRSNEVLSLKMNDVWVEGEGEEKCLKLAFKVEKRSRASKFCPKCNEKQSIKANFCKKCGTALTDKDIKKIKPPDEKIIKPKAFFGKNKFGVVKINPFVVNLLEWLKFRRTFGEQGYIFPPLRVMKGKAPYFDINSKMTTTALLYALRQINPALTSYAFRYHRSKYEYSVHHDIYALMKSGDWSSLRSVEHYLKSLGLTQQDKTNASLV